MALEGTIESTLAFIKNPQSLESEDADEKRKSAKKAHDDAVRVQEEVEKDKELERLRKQQAQQEVEKRKQAQQQFEKDKELERLRKQQAQQEVERRKQEHQLLEKDKELERLRKHILNRR